jgi:hypothetical protein
MLMPWTSWGFIAAKTCHSGPDNDGKGSIPFIPSIRLRQLFPNYSQVAAKWPLADHSECRPSPAISMYG